jgi:hypothetical protein
VPAGIMPKVEVERRPAALSYTPLSRIPHLTYAAPAPSVFCRSNNTSANTAPRTLRRALDMRQSTSCRRSSGSATCRTSFHDRTIRRASRYRQRTRPRAIRLLFLSLTARTSRAPRTDTPPALPPPLRSLRRIGTPEPVQNPWRRRLSSRLRAMLIRASTRWCAGIGRVGTEVLCCNLLTL